MVNVVSAFFLGALHLAISRLLLVDVLIALETALI